MHIRYIFRAVRPFISAIAVLATAAILVITIYFTQSDAQWTTFLAGILIAATLAEATGRSRAEWVAKRRTAQLAALKIKYDREAQLRKMAEKLAADEKSKIYLIDEVLSTMIAFVDSNGYCQYHNRAFLDWLHLKPSQVSGKHLRTVLGSRIYQETATPVRQSLDGHAAHYVMTQAMPNGAIYKLSVEHLPVRADNGKVTGFYILVNDITSSADVAPASAPEILSGGVAATLSPAPGEDTGQDRPPVLVPEQLSEREDAHRILTAIERGDFRLYCQLIAPCPINPMKPDITKYWSGWWKKKKA